MKMTKYWYKSFVTQGRGYILLDIGGDIRAYAPDLDGIVLARIHYGWGSIHKFIFDGTTLKIGKELK